jgi:ABC-type multidrug transport system fused ATPase/permease subunit
MWYCFWRWLGFRLELLGNFVILAAIIFAVLARDTIKGGIVGLSISYALQVRPEYLFLISTWTCSMQLFHIRSLSPWQITENLNWFVRMVSELETNVVAVERVDEYTKVPTEVGVLHYTRKLKYIHRTKNLEILICHVSILHCLEINKVMLFHCLSWCKTIYYMSL